MSTYADVNPLGKPHPDGADHRQHLCARHMQRLRALGCTVTVRKENSPVPCSWCELEEKRGK